MGASVVEELKQSFSTKKGSRHSFRATHGSQWPPSNTSCDLLVEVGSTTFSLHKIPLISKSGKIRKILQLSEAVAPPHRITLPAFPGDAPTFELAAKFCYGINIAIDAGNIHMLLCAANYLQMTEEVSRGNLISKAEAYLLQTILPDVTLAVAVLRRCGSLLPSAADINLVDTLVSHIAANFSGEEPHLAAISTLDPTFFHQFIQSMKTKTLNQESLSKIIIHYAHHYPQGLLSGKEIVSLSMVETVVSLLPLTDDSITTTFLSSLLKAAGGAPCREKIEKMMAMKLHEVVLEDILIPSSSDSFHHMYDVDVVSRIFSEFLRLKEDKEFEFHHESSLRKISKLMDGYLAEIALDSNLPPLKFISMAELLPDHARLHTDGLYRAVDLFLKVHPNMKEAERYRLCKGIDCQKLTEEARGHAAQNERLPVHVAMQVLYLEQRRLRSELTRGGGPAADSGVGSPRDSYVVVRRENRELRMEVARMRTRLSELEKDHVSMKKELVRTGPTIGIFKSFSRTLGKLHDFIARFDKRKGGPGMLTPPRPVDPRPFFLRRRRHSVS